MKTYTSLAEVDFSLNDLAPLPYPTRVVMTSPDYFEIKYVINAHMQGNIGTVNTATARVQWEHLKSAYETCGMEVDVVKGQSELPDMVFCANQTLPFVTTDGASKGIVLSSMFAKERAPEVQHFATHFAKQGYQLIEDLFNGSTDFEGMGDALWHSGKHLLWGGYGFRSNKSVYDLIAKKLDAPILLLRLDDPEFYHLDTCMCILDDDTVLIYPGAFQPEGLELVKHFFPRVLHAPEHEARTLFACNAHCPDRKHVLIQKGCLETNRLLKEHGFEVLEMDTDEYLKSGGSVFCMKLMTW